MPADTLPEYRVKARNTSVNSENPIHDDAVARQHGFPGALVPGVTLYAYLTHPLVAVLGAPWLERGAATVRFVAPVLDGEEVRVAGSVTAHDATGLTVALTGSTAARERAAVVTATLPAGSPTPVNLALYPAAPLPAERPPVSRERLIELTALGAPLVTYDEACAGAYLDTIGEVLPLYRGRGTFVHPAFFLDQANRALDRNVRLGPWVHVESRIRHLGGARVGETLETRGRVRSLYEKKGRQYVELDLVVLAGARPAAHVLHTAIYQLPPSPAR